MAENQNPKVSVIVPVYNEIHFLDECINSIRNQTFKSIEIILVDEGSTNGAKDICDKFGKLDERVRVIHKQNQGLSKARYDGFCNAKGEWIMFCDHDDKIHCKMLEDFFKFYEDKKSPDEIEIISGQATEDEKIATENFDKEGDEESVGADCCLGGGGQ